MKPYLMTLSILAALPVFADVTMVTGTVYDVGKGFWSSDSSIPAANKNDDSNLCWAATTSNILQLWQDTYGRTYNAPNGYATDSYILPTGTRYLNIFNTFRDNFDDIGSNMSVGIAWYCNGTRVDGLTTTGTGGYYKNRGVATSTYNISSAKNLKNALDTAFSKNGMAAFVGVRIYYPDGGVGMHAITCWGYETDENNNLTTLYMTDSDDQQFGARRFTVVDTEYGVFFESDSNYGSYNSSDTLYNIVSIYTLYDSRATEKSGNDKLKAGATRITGATDLTSQQFSSTSGLLVDVGGILSSHAGQSTKLTLGKSSGTVAGNGLDSVAGSLVSLSSCDVTVRGFTQHGITVGNEAHFLSGTLSVTGNGGSGIFMSGTEEDVTTYLKVSGNRTVDISSNKQRGLYMSMDARQYPYSVADTNFPAYNGARFEYNSNISFNKNSSSGAGGGIYTSGSLVFGANGTLSITGNTAATGSAIYVAVEASVYDSSLRMTRGELGLFSNSAINITDNKSTSGNVIYNQGSLFSVLSNGIVTISGNDAQSSTSSSTDGYVIINRGTEWNVPTKSDIFTIATASVMEIAGNDSVTFSNNKAAYDIYNEGKLFLCADEGQSITFEHGFKNAEGTSRNPASNIYTVIGTAYSSSSFTGDGSYNFVSGNANVGMNTYLALFTSGGGVWWSASNKLRVSQAQIKNTRFTLSSASLELVNVSISGSLAVDFGNFRNKNTLTMTNVTVAANSSLALSVDLGGTGSGNTVTLKDYLGTGVNTDAFSDVVFSVNGRLASGGTLVVDTAGLGNSVEISVPGYTLTSISLYKRYYQDQGWSGTVTWSNASGNGKWDSSSRNWSNGGATYVFTPNMEVHFGNTGAGTVTLAGTLTPTKVVVENSTGSAYTFTGSGQLSGTMTLTKKGTGWLTISTANTYTGTTYIQDGVLQTDNALALGLGKVELSGGTLDMAGKGVVNAITATGGEIMNANAYAGELTIASGEVTLYGEGTASKLIMNGGTLKTENYSDAASLVNTEIAAYSGTIDLNILGSSSVTVYSGDVTLKGVNRYSGETTINGGCLHADNDRSFGWSVIRLNGGTLNLHYNSMMFNTVYVTNGTLAGSANFNGTITVDGSLTLNGAARGGKIVLRSGSINAATSKSTDYIRLGMDGLEIQGGTINTNIQGSGPVTSSGTATLNGTATHSGATTITGGTFTVGATGSITKSTVTVQQGARLKATGSVTSAITLAGGTLEATRFTLSTATGQTLTSHSGTIQGTLVTTSGTTLYTAGASKLSGNLTLDGGTWKVGNPESLSISGSLLLTSLTTLDIRDLADYTTPLTIATYKSFSGNLDNIVFNTESATSRTVYTLSNTGNALVLTITGGATDLYWNGGSGTWSLKRSGWNLRNTSGGKELFHNGDDVVFNTSGTVTLSGEVLPNSITVAPKSGNTVQFSGSGCIGGEAELVMEGAGYFVHGGNNTYSGGTVIKSGMVSIYSSGSKAFGTGAISVEGGKLDLNSVAVANDIVISGGQVVNLSAHKGNLTIAGTTTLSGTCASPMVIVDGNVSGGTLTGHVILHSGDAGSTISQTGRVTVYGNSSISGTNSYTAATEIKNGVLTVKNLNALGSSTVKLQGGGINLNGLAITNGITVQEGTITGATAYKGAVVVDGGLTLAAKTAAGGGITVNSGVVQGEAIQNTAITLNGGGIASTIEGTSSVCINGSGQLGGTNTYTGDTVVKGLLVVNSEKAMGTGSVRLSGGELCLNHIAVSNSVIIGTGVTGTMSESENFTGTVSVYGELAVVDVLKAKQVATANNSAIVKGGTIVDTFIYSLGGTYASRITGSSQVYVKNSGDNVTTLTGNNTYTGYTYVEAGKLVVDNGNALGQSTVYVGSNGTISLPYKPVYNDIIAYGGVISGGNNYQGTLTIDGTVTNSFYLHAQEIIFKSGSLNNGEILNTPITAYKGEIAAAIKGTSSVLVEGDVTLGRANSHIGGTTISSGTLTLGSVSALGSGATTLAGGTLNMADLAVTSAITATGGGIANASAYAGELTINGQVGISGAATASRIYFNSGSLSGGELTNVPISAISGTINSQITGTSSITVYGDLTLTGANTYSSTTSIMSGTTTVRSRTPFGTGTVALVGGTVDFSAMDQVETGRLLLNSGVVKMTPGSVHSTMYCTVGGYDMLTMDLGYLKTGTYMVLSSDMYVGLASGEDDGPRLENYEPGTYYWTCDWMKDRTHLYVTILESPVPDDAEVWDGTGDVDAANVFLSKDITGGTQVINSNFAQTWSGSGSLAGGTTLEKNGVGTLTLNTDNSFSGGTNINAGCIVAGSANALGSGDIRLSGGELDMNKQALPNTVIVCGDGSSISGGVNYQGRLVMESGSLGGTTLNINQDAELRNGAIYCDLTGNAGVVKNTDGQAVLGGICSYSGPTQVTAGTLVLEGRILQSDVTVAEGARLDIAATGLVKKDITVTSATLGTSAMGMKLTAGQNLTLTDSKVAGGLATAADSTLTTSGTVNVTGDLTLNGGTWVRRPDSALTVGGQLNLAGPTLLDIGLLGMANAPYVLARFGSFSGDLGNITATTKPSASKVWSVVNTGTELQLVVTTVGDTRIWLGAKGTWSTERTTEWGVDGTSGKTARFKNGDNVVFNTKATVTLSGNVAPGSVTVATATAKDTVTFSGSGCIIGDGDLTKQGDGTLVLNAKNTYSGGTNIAGGTVKATGAASFGTGRIAIGNGKLDLAKKAVTNDIQAYGGTLAGATAYNGNLTINGDVTLAAATHAKTLTLESGSLTGGSISNTETILRNGTVNSAISGSSSVTVTGTVVLTAANSYTGDTVVDGGRLTLEKALTKSAVTVQDSGSLTLKNKVSKDITLRNGSLSLQTADYGMTLASGQTLAVLSGTVTGNVTTAAKSVFETGGAVRINGDLTLNGGTWDRGADTTLTITGNLRLTKATTLDVSFLDEGTYTLASYSGLIGNLSNLSLVIAKPEERINYALKETGRKLDLTVSSGALDLTWSGSGKWMTEGGKAWTLPEGVISDTFFHTGDRVLFNAGGSATIVGEVAPGSIKVEGAKATTFSGKGSITGDTSLVKEGAGKLTLNATNSYTGGTILRDGLVTVSGAESFGTGNVQIYGGTLNLNSKAVANAVMINGFVDVTNAKNFAGTFSVNSGGTLRVNANMGGTLVLNGGTLDLTKISSLKGLQLGTVVTTALTEISVKNLEGYKLGTYILFNFNADSMIDTKKLTLTGMDTSVDSLYVDGTQLVLERKQQPYTTSLGDIQGTEPDAPVFPEMTGTPSAEALAATTPDPTQPVAPKGFGKQRAGVYGQLVEGFRSGRYDGALEAMAAELDTAASPAAAKQILDSMDGAIHTTEMSAQIDGNRAALDTLNGLLGTAQATADGQDTYRFAVQATSANSYVKGNGNAPGYDRNSFGGLLMVERSVAGNAIIGLSAGYEHANVSVNGLDKWKSDDTRINAHAMVGGNRWLSRTIAGVGLHHYNLDHNVQGLRANASANGASFNFMQEISAMVPMGDASRVEPFLRVQSSYNTIDSFRESGSIGNAGLIVDSRKAWATTATLGSRYVHDFSLGGAIHPSTLMLEAGVSKDLGDRGAAVTARYAGDADHSHTLNAAAGRRWGAFFGGSLLVPLGESQSVNFGASVRLNGSRTEINANAGYQLLF